MGEKEISRKIVKDIIKNIIEKNKYQSPVFMKNRNKFIYLAWRKPVRNISKKKEKEIKYIL